ncbi:YbaK/EbsC family protein [Patescibacteria group bacterium]|nr:YbaK/EbsC family protein [Patescibacteria group bacterium]MBU4030702.1 YbaK/EbsC family protein [Patescibacteria group bacterium]MBU4082509.1 YbaK/EbsC family protein [Patescibacteria group bacterium]MCG2809580.1 YbaK/EbsC family protein [Candidatus Portnoybacteria bacterium]
MNNIEKFKSKCKILRHKKSGAQTENAALALSEKSSSIIKSILLKSGNQFLAAIISGDKKIDTKKIKKYFDVSKISFAKPEEVEKLTGFKIGGLPPYAFFDKCKVVIDANLMEKPYVIGAGGDEFTGMKFNPKDLLLLYGDVTDITI